MRTFIGILAATILMIGAAHATPKAKELSAGEAARNSPLWQEYLANCSVGGYESLKQQDKEALLFEARRKKDPKGFPAWFHTQIDGCLGSQPTPEQAAQKSPPQKSTFRKVEAAATPPAKAYPDTAAVMASAETTNAESETPSATPVSGNYEQVREYLRTYGGPLWQTKGRALNKYMDKEPPSSAVPCKPPGYDHVVLCNPRRR